MPPKKKQSKNTGKRRLSSSSTSPKSRRKTTSTKPPSSSKRIKQTPTSTSEIIATNCIYKCKKSKREYFTTVENIPLPLENYAVALQKHILKHHKNEHDPTWSISIGDIVISHIGETKFSPKKRYRMKSNAWYPFECTYCPLQIVAIYKEEGDVKIKVRWFHRVDEIFHKENKTYTDMISKDLDREWKPMREYGEEITESEDLDEVHVRSFIGKAVCMDETGKAGEFSKDMEHWYGDRWFTEGNKKSRIFVDKEGVPTVQFVCAKILGGDKIASNIELDSGTCHLETSFNCDPFEENDVMKKSMMKRKKHGMKGRTEMRRFWRGLQKFECDVKLKLLSLQYKMGCEVDTLISKSAIIQYNPLSTEESDDEMVSDASFVDDEEDKEADKATKSRKVENDLKEEEEEEEEEEDEEDESMWTIEPPFHVDVSSQRAFYMSMFVHPPLHHYATKNFQCNEDSEWKINLGDTVAIQLDPKTASKASNRVANDSRKYPFNVYWWCAEVVAIYRDFESRKEAVDLKTTATTAHLKVYGKYFLELRWLYRQEDMPGFPSTKRDEEELTEVFETDDVETFFATTLLGPAKLYSDPAIPENMQMTQNGMPLVNFFCQRFWSVHRRTLLPIGSSDTRLQRAMMYSKFMKRRSAARTSYESSLNPDEVNISASENGNWKARFDSTISKLTLSDASLSEDKTGVIGRNNEQSQIRNFLRHAINGVNTSNETIGNQNKNSFALFIGGPPGTGKTASVSSIIYELQQEQAAGTIPEFTFVSLNGMEMRHPFDTYVRLWEAVSENKEKLNRPKALAKLGLYFSELKPEEKNQKRRIVVLLVDEIDYLLTKQQTILYNLFDWPINGANNKSMAQLIVLGISNTINLPERLHERLQSRIGKQRCIYNSYSSEDCEKILEGKLGQPIKDGKSIFQYDALRFAARKVCSESGDIRKLFQLCKNATERVYSEIQMGKRAVGADGNCNGIVRISDIQKTAKDMFNSLLHQRVTYATNYEALLFVALASLKRNTGMERGEFTIEETLIKMESMANSLGSKLYIPCPQRHMLTGMLCRLGEAGVLDLNTPNGTNGDFGTNGAATLITFSLDFYEVLAALKDTRHNDLAQKFLGRTNKW